MPSFPVGYVQFHYDHAGEGAPVVFVHGGFAALAETLPMRAAARAWGDWERALAARFHFITYDRRGCGRSWCPESGYDLVNQAADLAALLDHLRIESAHVIGSSAGGPIAIVFAAKYPSRVRSLTVAGTGAVLFPEDDAVSDTIRAQIATLHRDGAEAAFDGRPPGVEAWLETLWRRSEAEAAGSLSSHLDLEAQLAEAVTRLPRDVRVHYYAAELRNMATYMTTDVAGFASEVASPSLVLHGAADRTVPPSSGEALARLLGGAELQVVPDVGHGVLWSGPRALSLLTDFIERAEARYMKAW